MPPTTKHQESFSRWGGTVPAEGRICPVHATVTLLGGKWKLQILASLLDGKRRFSDLRQHIPGITEKMLVAALRELEADGLVARIVYAQVPPKVEYGLIGPGEQLRPVLHALLGWGTSYLAGKTSVLASASAPTQH